MHLPSLPPLIEEDLVRVNELMRQRLNTEVALIAFAAQMLVHSQASRPRPALVMLVGRALGGDAERLRMLAGAVEFIHTSLQLHHELDGAPSEDTAPRACWAICSTPGRFVCWSTWATCACCACFPMRPT